jgi:hypothetical protein
LSDKPQFSVKISDFFSNKFLGSEENVMGIKAKEIPRRRAKPIFLK